MNRSIPLHARFLSLCGAAALSVAALGANVDPADAAVVIQHTTIYIDTLPKGCVKSTYNNGTVVVWRCGQYFYQPYNGRYVRVYIK